MQVLMIKCHHELAKLPGVCICRVQLIGGVFLLFNCRSLVFMPLVIELKFAWLVLVWFFFSKSWLTVK